MILHFSDLNTFVFFSVRFSSPFVWFFLMFNVDFSPIKLKGTSCSWWPAVTIAEFMHHLIYNFIIVQSQTYLPLYLSDSGKRVAVRRLDLWLVLQVIVIRKPVAIFRYLLLRQLKHTPLIIFSFTHWDKCHGWLVGAELMEPVQKSLFLYFCVGACKMLHPAQFTVFKGELRNTRLYLICWLMCVFCVCNWSVSCVVSKSQFSIPFSRVHKCIEWCSKSDRISREYFHEFNKLWISGLFFCWHSKYISLPDTPKAAWKPWAERPVVLPSLYSGLLCAKKTGGV